MDVNPNESNFAATDPRRDELPDTHGRLKLFGCLAGVLCLAFGKPLFDWVQLGLGSQLHSCALLIPFICVFLGWLVRHELPVKCSSAPAIGVMLIALGLVTLSAVRWLSPQQQLHATDALSLRIATLVLFINGVAFHLLGMQVMKKLAFPAAFLVFMVPLPGVVVNALEVFFQHTSAEVASWIFSLSGVVVYHDRLSFTLPGLDQLPVRLLVAQECSGIRSSYALFLTSLLAGHLLMRTKTSKILLAIFVIPLGIVRNAFRVFTLGMLASQYDRGVLDSPLHHQGGPIFFALSLLPFFAVVILMKRWERRNQARASSGA